ncbi:MAG TPA: hypothetical protein VGC82_22390 [Rhodopila sp.]
MTEQPDQSTRQQEAAIAGPGVIAGQQANPQSGARGIASGALPDVTGPTTHHIGEVAVGTPGMGTDQAGIAPGGTGMSGQPTNDQSPGGGRRDDADQGRTPPDMVTTPGSENRSGQAD